MNPDKTPKALVVDDNPFNREVLKTGLSSEGFDVEESRNGKEALSRIDETPFDIIFMDLLMPGMDGFEAIRKIRLRGVSTPIIIISSMTSREDRKRCIEVGGNDFLPKPVTPETIRRIAAKVAEGAFTETRASAKDPDISDEIRFSDYSVLLAESDDGLSEQFEKILAKLGFSTERSPGGEDAMEKLTGNPGRPDIIITNLFNPDIDGLGLLANIKRDYPEIMVFIYSQDHDPETAELALQLGADGFINQNHFESMIGDTIRSAVYYSTRKGSRTEAASTARQVRKAQEQLIRFGCSPACDTIDIGYASLTDAGGDLACCRKFNESGRCGVFLGDVSGHNVMSSYISAISLGILSSKWDNHQDPSDLIKTMNSELCRSGNEYYHICASALLWDRLRNRIKLSAAGNPSAFVFNPNRLVTDIQGGGMCLGLLQEDSLFLHHDIDIEEGSYLFVHSDGVEKEEILQVLESGRVYLDRKSMRGLCDSIIDAVLENRMQHDDIILIALKQTHKFKDLGLYRSFESNFDAVDEACNWVSGIFDKSGPPEGHDPDFILLAVREALVNAVKYGNPLQSGHVVDVSLYREDGALEISVSDQGAGFDLPENIKPVGDLCSIQMGGRGLSCMFTVADELHVAGSTVTMVFNRKPPLLKNPSGV